MASNTDFFFRFLAKEKRKSGTSTSGPLEVFIFSSLIRTENFFSRDTTFEKTTYLPGSNMFSNFYLERCFSVELALAFVLGAILPAKKATLPACVPYLIAFAICCEFFALAMAVFINTASAPISIA